MNSAASTIDRHQQQNQKWMNAFSDALAGLNTLATCMALADLNGDGDHQLIVADLGTGKYNMRLRVYKGVAVLAENALVDLPAALTTFFIGQVSSPSNRSPCVLIGSTAGTGNRCRIRIIAIRL